MKKRLFITGASGFIGRNFIEKYNDKYIILAPTHSELDLLNTNAVESFFQQQKIDIVIHLANVGGARNTTGLSEVSKTNLRMFFNIVRCKKYFDRMINCGSGAEYDKSEDVSFVSEDDFDKRIPADEYGIYKYTCAKFAEGVDYITHLRAFGVYGEYEDYRIRFISNSICRILLNLPITINQNAIIDYIYVDDLVKIIDYFICNSGQEKFYNVGSGDRLSLFEVAKKIVERSGKDIKIEIKKEGLNKEYTCDIARLKEEIPNLFFTTVDEAVDKLFMFYKDNVSTIKKEEILFD